MSLSGIILASTGADNSGERTDDSVVHRRICNERLWRRAFRLSGVLREIGFSLIVLVP